MLRQPPLLGPWSTINPSSGQAAGLINCWPCADGGGTSVRDIVGQALAVNTTINPISALGTGVCFAPDGVARPACTSVPISLRFQTGSFTVCTFFQLGPAGLPDTDAAFMSSISGYGTGDNGGWELNFGGFYTAYNVRLDYAPSLPIDQKLHHYAATFDGTTTRLYYDGKFSNSGSIGRPGASTNSFNLSRRGPAPYYQAKGIGRMKDARAYSRCLSDGEIANIANTPMGLYTRARTYSSAFLSVPFIGTAGGAALTLASGTAVVSAGASFIPAAGALIFAGGAGAASAGASLAPLAAALMLAPGTASISAAANLAAAAGGFSVIGSPGAISAGAALSSGSASVTLLGAASAVSAGAALAPVGASLALTPGAASVSAAAVVNATGAALTISANPVTISAGAILSPVSGALVLAGMSGLVSAGARLLPSGAVWSLTGGAGVVIVTSVAGGAYPQPPAFAGIPWQPGEASTITLAVAPPSLTLLTGSDVLILPARANSITL